MDTYECGHAATWPAPVRLCPHLVEARASTTGPDYVRLLTGKGTDADLSCRACADLQGWPTLVSACGGCLEWVEEYGGCVGVRGTPGLGIWDPRTGERLARIPGFSPTRHHPAARELVEIQERRLTRWRLAPRSEPIAAVGRQA
jgi:hypothetical protein